MGVEPARTTTPQHQPNTINITPQLRKHDISGPAQTQASPPRLALNPKTRPQPQISNY